MGGNFRICISREKKTPRRGEKEIYQGKRHLHEGGISGTSRRVVNRGIRGEKQFFNREKGSLQ